MRSLAERVAAKIAVQHGCWVWMGRINRDGYGHVRVGKKTALAHRAVFEMAAGPVARGLELDHLCRHRCCVNPLHMEAVTHRENVMRGDGYFAQAARGVSWTEYTRKRRCA